MTEFKMIKGNEVAIEHPSVIDLQSVSLTLSSEAGPVEILKNITFSIPKGQSVGIVGPSGSGKSSLMSLMTGLEQATTGTVTIAGLMLGSANEDQLASHRLDHIGIVMQAFHLIPTMTALENVAVPLELAGHKNAFDKAEQDLKSVGLAHRLRHYPAQLSGGEQQRVALARALAPEPAILFGDEPTGNLDGTTGNSIVDLIFDLAVRRGSTLILITHDAGLAERCQRVLTLRDGCVAEDRLTRAGLGENASVVSKIKNTGGDR